MKNLIFVILILTVQYYAQNPEWINLTNGDKVFSIVSSGNNLWIGTDGGLVKLNKETEEIAFYNRANANLPDNHIRTLAIDSSGYLWIGTQFEGIGRFDGYSCQVYNTRNSPLPFDQWNMEIEVDAEGKIWIGSLKYLVKFNGTDWVSYETGNPLSAYYSINDIFFDRNGIEWIAASWGVGRFNSDSVIVENIEGLNNDARVIQEDKENHIWVGTQWNGLFEFDGINWTEYDTSNSDIPSNNIYDMKFDYDGNLWLATGNGLVKLDGSNWEIFNTTNSGLLQNEILSIEIDEKGIIWLGFFNYGLMKFDGINWKKYNLSNSILPSNAVYVIEFDDKDNVWLGTGGNSLINYNRNTWSQYDSSNSGLLNTVYSLKFDNKENLWIGYKYNIIEYNGNFWLSKYNNENWLDYDSTNSPFSRNLVNCIKTDTYDNLWIGTGKGLVKFDGINWTIYNMGNTPLTSNLINDIEFDKNGNLWCGLGFSIKYDDNGNPTAMEGSLAKFDGNSWNIYNTYNSDLPINNVGSLAIDSENSIWISTWEPGKAGIEYGGGLTKFDGTTWTTFNINNSPLTSNTIFDITVDKDDNLWLSTCAGGLVKYDKKNSWTIYNVRNSGIAFDSQSLVAIDSYGNKWIGHNESGLSVFREGGVILTDVKENKLKQLPGSFALYQNYPNPFNPTTRIKYSIADREFVTLKVYDILGKEIATLVNKEKLAGNYEVEFNGSNLSSGVYFYRIQAGEFTSTKKFILLK